MKQQDISDIKMLKGKESRSQKQSDKWVCRLIQPYVSIYEL
jgi:hypothetical protein